MQPIEIKKLPLILAKQISQLPVIFNFYSEYVMQRKYEPGRLIL